MHRFIATIFILACITSNAQRINPPLLVPFFPTTVPVVEGKIFLPAYNMDMLRLWPEDLHTYNAIVHGSNGTLISLKKKNQLQKIKLEQAIRNKEVNVFSITATVYGRNPGLVIEPMEGVTLVSLQTKGFVISDSLTQATVTGSMDTTQYKVSAGGYDLNTMHVHTYKLNQQDVWKKAHKPVVDNPQELKKLTEYFVQRILTGTATHPPYYKESIENGTIYIRTTKIPYDSARTSATYYNDNGQHYFMVKEIADGFKQLIAYPAKDSVGIILHFSTATNQLDSIVIQGKWKGILPMRVCFITNQKVRLTALLEERQQVQAQGSTYNGLLILGYDFGDSRGLCNLKLPAALNCSASQNEVVLEACTILIRAKPSDIIIDL